MATIGNVTYFYEAYMSRLQKKAVEAVNNAIKDSYIVFMPKVKEKLEEFYKEAVDKFYAYKPVWYSRNESLRNLLEITVDEDELGGSFNEGAMTTTRSGESLYGQVFKDGYHGGARIKNSTTITSGGYKGKSFNFPHPDTGGGGGDDPHFGRVPNGKFYKWGRPVKKESESPYEHFIRLKDAYMDSDEYQGEFNRIFNEKVKEIEIH